MRFRTRSRLSARFFTNPTTCNYYRIDKIQFRYNGNIQPFLQNMFRHKIAMGSQNTANIVLVLTQLRKSLNSTRPFPWSGGGVRLTRGLKGSSQRFGHGKMHLPLQTAFFVGPTLINLRFFVVICNEFLQHLQQLSNDTHSIIPEVFTKSFLNYFTAFRFTRNIVEVTHNITSKILPTSSREYSQLHTSTRNITPMAPAVLKVSF